MQRKGQGSFHAAFDAALAELDQIRNEFTQMRVRKERVEGVLQALTPLVGSAEFHAPRDLPFSLQSGSPMIEPEPTPAPNQVSAQSARLESTRSANVSPDPIQKRIDSILGLATA
jgi:hypothetical protein